MSAYIGYETAVLIYSLCTGVGLMMIYDLLRLFRLVVRHGDIWVNLEDFGYWIYAGVATFLLLYRQNNGILRAYIILSVLIGMGLYDVSISHFLFTLLKKIKKYIKMKKKNP